MAEDGLQHCYLTVRYFLAPYGSAHVYNTHSTIQRPQTCIHLCIYFRKYNHNITDHMYNHHTHTSIYDFYNFHIFAAYFFDTEQRFYITRPSTVYIFRYFSFMSLYVIAGKVIGDEGMPQSIKGPEGSPEITE